MKKRGFIPFTTAGFMILMLVVATIAHASWSRHQLTLGSVEGSASTRSITIVASVQNDIQHLARYAIYEALWEVGKHASEYSNDEARVDEIERLAGEYLAEYLTTLPKTYERLNARVGLELDPSVRPSFDLRQGRGGYVVARVELPQTRIIFSSQDNGLTIDLPYESFEVWVDSRYFLLQGRMNRFIEKLDDVRSTWRWAEYATAWGEAYLGGRVRLSESRSKALFELAWAGHELETFGSSDYLATSGGLSELSPDALSGLFDSNMKVEPLVPIDVRTLCEFIDRGLEALGDAEAELRDADNCIGQAVNYFMGENSVSENACQKLNDCMTYIDRAQGFVEEAHQQFEQLVDFIAESADGNPLVQQLHQGLTSSTGGYPAPMQMISLGAEGTEDKLTKLKDRVNSCMLGLRTLDRESAENSLKSLQEHANITIRDMLAEPATKVWIEYEEYPRPNDYDPNIKPEKVTRKVGIYITDRRDGTIGALKTVLKNIRADLGKIEKISGLTPKDQGCTQVDGGLKNRLIEALDSKPNFTDINREEIYEVFPPKPIKSQPGISVFHDFSIKSVEYKRQDPMGLLLSSEPTPIYLWFIGVTLYWAQWDVTLELDDEAVEQVFDFDNPTLPRSLLEEPNPSFVKIHKPLGYRSEIPRNRFGFILILVSPRYFSIDGG